MGGKGSGVEVRERSIRLFFILNGERVRETLTLNGAPLKPTPANIKHAHRIAEEIRRKIGLEVFRFADYFPDSPRAKKTEDEAITFGKLADLWEESQGRLSAATKDQYATALRFWKRLLGEDTLIEKIGHKLLAAKIGGYPWPSAKTHNNYLIALRGVLGLEYRGAKTLANPLAGIENMPVVKKLPDPFLRAERDMILGDIQSRYDLRVYAYFLWMFYTGMRPEEAIALRWSDIDTQHGIARVQRVRTFRGSERDGSKTHTERDVDLLDQALEALAIMRSYTFMLRTDRDGDPDNSADIFQNPITGRPWHDERSQRDTYWRPCLKRLGIRWRRPYNTRHTYATELLMARVPAAYIASQLGHSVKMLLERYARWMPGNDNGRAREMAAEAMNSSPQVPQKQKGRA